MLRRVLLALLLSPLIACAQSEAPTAGATATSATPAVEAPAAPTDSAAPVATPAATQSPVADPAQAPQVASNEPAPAPAPPTGEPPRLGTDYEILETPQPTWGRGKIEVAEVFGYTCIHCANLQPDLDAWHKRLPADVRFEYVPAAFGGAWDTFARAYFAAELLGVREKTHNAVFDAIHLQHKIEGASNEAVADLYGTMGVDRDKFLAAMTSFGVTAKINKARTFAQRTGITATPTIIVNGKYRVNSSRDRGFPGMLATIDYLVALERAGQPAGAP